MTFSGNSPEKDSETLPVFTGQRGLTLAFFLAGSSQRVVLIVFLIAVRRLFFPLLIDACTLIVDWLGILYGNRCSKYGSVYKDITVAAWEQLSKLV